MGGGDGELSAWEYASELKVCIIYDGVARGMIVVVAVSPFDCDLALQKKTRHGLGYYPCLVLARCTNSRESKSNRLHKEPILAYSSQVN